MKFSPLRILLAAIAIGSTLVGCDHAHRQEVRTDSKTKDDPTAWSASPLTNKGKDDSESRSTSESSESLSGALSKRGADIERSLGVMP